MWVICSSLFLFLKKVKLFFEKINVALTFVKMLFGIGTKFLVE